MSDAQEQLTRAYERAANGDRDALLFLHAFHAWAHELDDFIDEAGHEAVEVPGLCAKLVTLCSAAFFRQHAEALGAVLNVVAVQYAASMAKDQPDVLTEGWRVSGNQVVLAVAWMTGGPTGAAQTAQLLWPVVVQTQLEAQGSRLKVEGQMEARGQGGNAEDA